MTRLSRSAAALLALLACAAVSAETIEMGKPMPRYALLKQGEHRYLRYVHENGGNFPIDIWSRVVRFEQRDGKGPVLLHVSQRWDAVTPVPSTRTLDSWFEKDTFRPLSHLRITEKEGKRTVEGFQFGPDKVSGMPDLADNTQKALAVPLAEPTFNFETDIEMLQTLPWAAGYEAVINFYHPGGPAPARYTFRVANTDTLAGPGGPVECWLVTTDYNRPGSVASFWFAKATGLLVKQQSTVGPGKTLVKLLIE